MNDWRETSRMIHESVAKPYGAYSEEDTRHLALALAGEVGEIANLVKKAWRGDAPLEALRPEIAKEIADVAIYLELLAAGLEVDVDAAATKVANENVTRFGVEARPPGACYAEVELDGHVLERTVAYLRRTSDAMVLETYDGLKVPVSERLEVALVVRGGSPTIWRDVDRRFGAGEPVDLHDLRLRKPRSGDAPGERVEGMALVTALSFAPGPSLRGGERPVDAEVALVYSGTVNVLD